MGGAPDAIWYIHNTPNSVSILSEAAEFKLTEKIFAQNCRSSGHS